MSDNPEALREALTEMLEAWEEQFGAGACDCMPEPENAGHVCQCCKARAALAQQAATPTLASPGLPDIDMPVAEAITYWRTAARQNWEASNKLLAQLDEARQAATPLHEALADQRRRLGAEHDATLSELARVRSAAADEIASLTAQLAAAQQAATPTGLPLRVIAALNEAMGGNEWQGDASPPELAGPAAKAITTLAAARQPATPAPAEPSIAMRPMEADDGRKGWYIDHPDFYCDIEPDEETGALTVFFRDKTTAKEAFAAAPPATPAPAEPVAFYEGMRVALLVQIHELIDVADRHARTTGDPDEKRATEGAIEYARRVSAPYNYNGAAPPATPAPAWLATRLWNRREAWTCPADVEADLRAAAPKEQS